MRIASKEETGGPVVENPNREVCVYVSVIRPYCFQHTSEHELKEKWEASRSMEHVLTSL